MKQFLIGLILVFGAASVSWADGFLCRSSGNELHVNVYNQVRPELGTRKAATMILANPSVSQGRQTIAKFSAENKTLTSQGVTYTSRVDLRYNDSGRKGELVAGTKLGSLAKIHLTLFYAYNRPVPAGTFVPGTVLFEKRNGETFWLKMECSRYLKNPAN